MPYRLCHLSDQNGVRSTSKSRRDQEVATAGDYALTAATSRDVDGTAAPGCGQTGWAPEAQWELKFTRSEFPQAPAAVAAWLACGCQ